MGVDSCRSLVHMGCERFPCRRGQTVQVCAACASEALVCIANLRFGSQTVLGTNKNACHDPWYHQLGCNVQHYSCADDGGDPRPQYKIQLGICRLQLLKGP